MTIHSPAHDGDVGISERAEPPYATSLHAFMVATRPFISEGWVEHFNQMTQSLWAINNPSRAFLCFQGAQVEVGHFSVKTSQFDPVVAGVTRKAGQRMASTCQVCGHAGKQRVLGLRTLILCPRCYAKDALRADLRTLFYDLKSKAFLAKGVYVETDIPPRASLSSLCSETSRTCGLNTPKARSVGESNGGAGPKTA
jgi:hypothetical protein